MKEAGLSESFIEDVIKTYDASTTERVIQLNVLGFLKKADYSAHLSPNAIKKCHEVLRKHRKHFLNVKKIYGVEPEVIAALLWVETKHGKMMGKFPVSSVYFSLLQADHPSLVESSYKALTEKVTEMLPEYEPKLKERSKTKAQWALGELKALETLQKTQKKNTSKLKGSFAGAFGVPQFIPSSYSQWAKASKKGSSPDLFKMEDAIYSVASYLSSNGWKSGEPDAQKQALFHYNRSQGYVDVILKIASCVSSNSPKDGRVLASDAANPIDCSSL